MRGETTYTYDKQNRLESVTNPDGSTTTYTYDKAGNRATETTVENGVETVKSYIYNGRNQLLTVERTVAGVAVSKTTYTYDANGNQLSEVETQNDVSVTKLTNTYDLRNQLICSVTEDAVINNAYNASGYRVEKTVSKNGTTTKTYFLYDSGSVIMESDGSKVTAKNTYGGPLLLRTVFGDIETTYQYMYNAHGDVVTLLANGEVAATYYYDSFGNVLEQTGDVDNSILYAGYQYDEETGLYYINARMYDPVTARFLQADTYLGSLNDPLSLNLYTYCLNNPHKYTDPSGHIPLLLIGVALLVGAVSAQAEYNRQVREGDNYTNWVSVGVVGISNTLLCLIPGGKAVSAYKMATVGGSFVLKTFAVQFGKAVGLGVAAGYATDAGIEVARQLATGTKLSNLEYDRINEAGVTGAIAGGAGAIFGTGMEALANTRLGQSVAAKFTQAVSKGKNAIKNGFAKVAGKSGKKVGQEALEKRTAEMVSESELKRKAEQAVRDMIETTSGGKRKSMAIGAYDVKTGQVVADFAGPIPEKISPILRKRAEKIGGIGSFGLTDRNTVGVCAEFRATNQLLLMNSEMANIRLTAPIRPRTGEIRPNCLNCVEMFSDILSK